MDYLDNWPRVQEFYARDYSLDAIQRFARERPALDPAHREKLGAALAAQQKRWGGGPRGAEKIAAGAAAVVTGQQPMLFSGPHFSILKAVSIIRIAAELERAGIPAVPVFWVAAEDHDHEELESAWVLGRNSELARIQIDLANSESAPAGWMAFGGDIQEAVNQCMNHLPQSEFSAEVRALLADSYVPGASPVVAFARMMAQLHPESELTFVDPLDPALKSLAQPVIDLAIRRNAEMRAAVLARSRAVSAAGYHEQVRVDEGFTGLFAYRGRSRQVLRPAEVRPGIAWSPNVLLRPVVQDTIFPTAVYVAGPAEVAYFAQAAAVYETLDVPMPPVFPRISATLLEPRIARAAEKYRIAFSDVFRGREYLKRRAVDALENGKSFDQIRARIEEELESLRPVLGAVDPTLLGALDTSRQKMMHQIEALHGKFSSAAARRDELLERHLDAILNSLFPGKKLQERVINIASFLDRYGFGIVRELGSRLSLDTREHQVLEI
jgi:uncharacterized protein YllA (UPF0747 family)